MKAAFHKVLFLPAAVLVLVFFSGFHLAKKPLAELEICFLHKVGEKELRLDSAHYTNALGQDFTVSKFKYYISNICLKNASGCSFSSGQSFLIDEEYKKQIALREIPSGEYSAIEFIIGVDSLHNCSGAQSGDLDPVNAMFWAWNTGYIFMKLEGFAPLAASPGHFFEYHIGGYQVPSNCIRKIVLPLTQVLVLKENQTKARLLLKVDILALLNSDVRIDFEKLPAVTDRRNATTMADNYKNMFSVATP